MTDSTVYVYENSYNVSPVSEVQAYVEMVS